jgi:uncharacterized protein YegP (UPF0339 family)
MEFELYKEGNTKYFFRVVDEVEEILLSTDGYQTKERALENIESVMKNVPVPTGIEKMETEEGDYFFYIMNARGQVICTSTMFYSPVQRDNWLNDNQKEVPQLDVVEV